MTLLTDTAQTSGAQTGVTALGPRAAVLLTLLDRCFESWGLAAGAQPMILPPLLPVDRLARLDYYTNFPQQALVAAPLRLKGADASHQPDDDGSFAPESLDGARFALPSAACYGVYLHLGGQAIDEPLRVTVSGRCFRREDHYDDLRRMLGFHMREIVALGTRDYVEEHLHHFTAAIEDFASRLDLPLRREAASDPFYDRGGPRAFLQRLDPVKHEFLFGDLAISSVNVHRNFFGERCDIRLGSTGEFVHTGCVAFGLERWLTALTTRFGGWAAATAAVERVLADG